MSFLRRVFSWAVGNTLLLPAAALAQEGEARTDTVVYRVEGIRVEAQRGVTTIGGTSAIEVTVDSMSLPASVTTEELLRELPIIHVRTNSRGEAEISVRGSESRQVAVLLGGVPLTLGWDARTDVSVLPAGAVTEIRLVPGLSSILHGPNVLGGVVEMDVTRASTWSGRSSLTASAGIDDRGGYSSAVVGERPFSSGEGRGTIRAGVGHRDSPGFPLPDGVEEPVPVDDNLRLNTDMSQFNGFVAFRYEGGGGAWGSFSAAAFKAERGIGAELGAEDPRLWRYPHISRTIVLASAGTGDRETRWGWGDLEAAIGVDLGRTEIRSYTTRAYEEIDGSEDGDDRTLTLRLLADHTLGSRADLRASYTFADIQHDATVDGTTSEYAQRLMSLAGETVIRLLDRPEAGIESLRLSAGGAYDRGTTPETGGLESLGTLNDWGARVGLLALTNDGGTVFHAGVSRRGRLPALRETYSESLSRFVPNPDLHPEHLLAVEGGMTTRLGDGEVQIVGFRHKLTDAIRRISVGGGRRMRVNSDELLSTGLEVLFSQTFGSVGFGGDLTLQAVELTDPESTVSTEPENVPERSGSAHVRFPLFAGIAATAEAEYTGPQFCQHPDTGEDVELEGGTWLNTTLSRVWSGGRGRRIETRVSGHNLADKALYDQCGLPRAGRLLRVELRLF